MPVASHQNANDAKVPVLLHVDPAQPGHSQYGIHNRWHPDIPSIGSIEAGRSYKVQCLDYSGGQIKNDDDVQDVKDLNHDSDHHLSGPFDVASAQPGDLLEIEIQSVEPFPDHAWGYSVVAPGLGSLDHPDYTTRYVKSIWDFDGPFTSSRHVPGVRFVGRPHPGVVGTAPSHELLRQWNERESRCVAGDADLPCRNGAYVGQTLQQDVGDRIYAEGARTSPAREHGGNIDIGGLVGGSKLYLPVYVPGAKLSFGDCHFSIGDGEPTTAIEMAGIVTFKVNILPARAFKISSPAYLTSPSKPQYGERLVFTGLSASGDQQSSMDGMTAYRNAAFQAIDHLVKHGFSREQAYILLAVAPIETRIVATANRPNMTVSLGLPLGIFDVDIRPRDSSLY